ncbi:MULTISPECIES: GAF domain-containing protein [Paenarthrobacter]|uniref:GAF domain-containing protein n=1 Tax=Paenarthrobacter ureafaciens TaxID=37931 RepID=A0AAX3EMT3_PAEUR|nr:MULTISPECIES: GAF domain-containing protein [Paenarthrobacter]MDO5875471.1 GAF domain-containing protein [Paenarthrobacter sp. SD-1]UYV94821.1 GAF domain-containing protein [Paenarthrobacter ureafaciens]UYV99349.1 GAF domain-containing protein [Paenarthrobacter ureafaciens]WIV30668.1 GAF domain-containing protein [Paenarthrobacter sp. R1]
MKVRPDRIAEQLQGWLHAVAEIGSAVNHGASLDVLLSVIAETACRLMDYDFCAITLPDPEHRVLLIRGSFGLSGDYIRDVNATHPIRLHGVSNPAPSSQAFTLGVAVQVADTRTNPSFGPWGGVASDQGFLSMISVPLNTASEILGTLNCYTTAAHAFSEEEEALLTMLADQAAIAITTARLKTDQARTIEHLNRTNATLEEQYDLQRQGAEVHERLTALALEGGGVPTVSAALAELIDRPVTVRGANGALLCNSLAGADSLPGILTRKTSYQHPEPAAAGPQPQVLAQTEVLSGNGVPVSVLHAPVMIKDEIVAWIWTSGELEALGPLDRRTIEHAATVMALELLRTRTAAEAAWRHSGEILSGLLSGAVRGSTALINQAASLGHDLSQPHAVMVARYDDGLEGPLQYRLASTLMRLSENTTPKPLLGMHGGYVVALLPVGNQPLESVRAVSEDIRRSLAGNSTAAKSAITVITGPVNDPSSYPETFDVARGAVELAALRGLHTRTLVLSDLGMAGLFLQVPDASRLESYCEQVLGPLRTYDRAQGTALLPTLSALIRNDLNTKSTAEQLFVHKNTVDQRRRRIEDVLGLQLTSIDALTHISTALTIDDVIQARAT